MVRRSAAFGRARISLLKENASRSVFRLVGRFLIIAPMFWTLILSLSLRVLLASFTSRGLGWRGVTSGARGFLRSVSLRTRMVGRGAGCTGPATWRDGVPTACWSFWAVP